MGLGEIDLATVPLLSTGNIPLVQGLDMPGVYRDALTAQEAAVKFKGHLDDVLQKEINVKLLSIWPTEPQVLFCNGIESISDLRGRPVHVPTSNTALTDFMNLLRARPLDISKDQIYDALREGKVHCAVGGAASGNQDFWHEVTNQLYILPFSWEFHAHVVSVRVLDQMGDALRREVENVFLEMEEERWQVAQDLSDMGIACNTSRRSCTSGNLGSMELVEPTERDYAIVNEVLQGRVIPLWVNRCGRECEQVFNDAIAPIVGIKATSATEAVAVPTATATAVPPTPTREVPVERVIPTATPTPFPVRAGPQYGGVLTGVLSRDPFFSGEDLNPYGRYSGAKGAVNSLLFNTLVRFEPQPGVDPALWSLAPDLLEAWELSGNGTSWTMALRRDVLFHDGTLLTATDVISSFKTMLESPTNVFERMRTDLVDLEVFDDFTFRISFSQPWPDFLEIMARPLAPIVQGRSAGSGDPDLALIGTGPFMFADYAPDQELVLERNPNYFRRNLPYLDAIEIYINIQDRNTQLAILRTGRADFHNLEVEGLAAKLSVDEAAMFQGNPEFVLDTVPGAVLALWFDTQTGPFNDLRIRRAVSLAIDRQGLIEILYNGNGEAQGPVPAAYYPRWATPLENLNWSSYGPDIAKTLLAEAGYPDGFVVQLYVTPQPTFPRSAAWVRRNPVRVLPI